MSGDVMMRRIIFCHGKGCGDAVANGYVRLGEVDGGEWAEVTDEALRALLTLTPRPSVLFFSREEYRQAFRDLTPEEAQEAVRHRLRHWSPQMLEQTLQQFYLGERRCLTLTALARAAIGPARSRVLDSHFEGTLGFLGRIVGAGRYRDVTPTAMLMYILESETQLVEALRSAAAAAGARGDADEQRLLEESIQLEERHVKALGRALHQTGGPQVEGAPLQVDLTRGVLVVPLDPDLRGYLRTMGLPVMPWRGGGVTIWPLRRIPELSAKGKEVTVLYLGAGELREDMTELTQAQLNIELSSRLMGSKRPVGEVVGDHLNSLRLEQNLLKRNALDATKPGDWQVPVLKAQIEGDTNALRFHLEHRPSWLPGSRSPKPLQELLDAEQAIVVDATLFNELWRREGNAEMASQFELIRERKKQDIERLTKEIDGSVSP